MSNSANNPEYEPLMENAPSVSEGYVFPASFAQQRLWFLNQLDPESAAYNRSFGVRLTGPVDGGVIRQCLDEIMRRHEILRTVFAVLDGQPVQVITPGADFLLIHEDLSALPGDARQAEIERHGDFEARAPFDLAAGPLARARLLRLGAEDHVLLLTLHHIISDAWSDGILLREISGLYEAHRASRPPRLPGLPIQYADFAVWQRQWLSGEILERQQAYWMDRLRDIATLNLPSDRPRPVVATYAAGSVLLRLDSGIAENLKALGQRSGATLFMVLLAAFQLLLARWSGQTDIVIGSPIAGRNRAETENLIGCFVNTLVLRAGLSGNPGFSGLVARTREDCLGAYAHQDIPFEKLVEDLRIARDMSYHPLFQVMFVLQNAAPSKISIPGVELRAVDSGASAAMFDLNLDMREAESGLNGCLTYSTDLFDQATMERFLSHYRRILEEAARDSSRGIRDIPLLTERESTQILRDWNATVQAYPSDKTIHELFEAQVRKTPGAIAVIHEEEEVTYADLNARANRLAGYLRRNGIEPEALAGIFLERSVEMAVALLAVLKAGGAYVPLDPAYPLRRIGRMLDEARPAVLITRESLIPQLPELPSNTRIIPLDRVADELAECSDQDMAAVDPLNLAYVLFTSGSTGRPKGSMVSHQSVVNFAVMAAAQFGLGPGDRFLQLASLSFDVAVEEIFPAWISGAAVVLHAGSSLISGGDLLRLIERQRLTAFEIPTSYWHEFLTELEQPEAWVPDCLRFIIVGCEKMSAEKVRAWSRFGIPLIHVYGLTETAVTSTLHHAAVQAQSGCTLSLPIGRPVDNTRLYLLDAHGAPVPVGVAGELYIGGAGVARGYLGYPDQTAARFVPDPWSTEPGARLFRTGDLVRYRVDGNIEFLGRIDDQVKIRGFRVELGDIEAALAGLPGVRACVVMAREDIGAGKRLVAYIVAEEQIPSVPALRAALAELLPEYMIPGLFVFLDSLPLTVNGKTDRRALPAPSAERLDQASRYVSPRTDIEAVMARIWSDVLGLEKVGVEDNFFEIGGHSLLLINLHGKLLRTLESEMSRNISLVDLFKYPTIGQLARYLQQSVETRGPDDDDRVEEQRDGGNRMKEMLRRKRIAAENGE